MIKKLKCREDYLLRLAGSGEWSSIRAALLLAWCRLSKRHRSRGAQDDDWFAIFVLGSSLHLSPFKVHHHARLFSRSETQNAPVDRNLPVPDAEEPAEIDYGGTDLTGVVDDYVNDAAHVFIRNAADFPAEDRLHRQRVKDCR
jgi:hypothetical protein